MLEVELVSQLSHGHFSAYDVQCCVVDEVVVVEWLDTALCMYERERERMIMVLGTIVFDSPYFDKRSALRYGRPIFIGDVHDKPGHELVAIVGTVLPPPAAHPFGRKKERKKKRINNGRV